MGNKYTAAQLSVLEGLEAVRVRPGMYIGSTNSRGLMHCLWEITDNAVDEALEGHGERIEIILYPDQSVEVRDSGRGIPVDNVPGLDISGAQVVYTKLHAGGKFGGGSYGASGGLHGVGASVVNALSSRLDVEIDRGGKTHRISFQRGIPGEFAGPGPQAKFTPAPEETSALAVVGKIRKNITGTRVRYWADPQIFTPDAEFNLEELLDRARQTTFLVPGLTVAVRDIRSGDSEIDSEHVFRHDGGSVNYVDFLATDPPVSETIHLRGSAEFEETVAKLDGEGHLVSREVTRTCEVDLALRWGNGYDTRIRSFVNIIATPKGGTHLAGFEAGLVRAVRRHIEANTRRYKVTAKDPRIEKDDVLSGLTAVVSVRIPEPQFEGQTKEILGTGPVRAIVAKVIDEGLTEIFDSTKRDAKQDTQAIMNKVVSEMRARVAARVHKEIARRKNALESSTLPTKLADCRSEDVERCELFIVEGDSALGTAKLARSSEFQALLPIRGKILNVQKASAAEILKNTEVASIIQVVGAGIGRTFDLDLARYGKIILMTDADVDGAHIRTLLLTLFFRYMRPLVAAGRVYAAMPPLHRVEIMARGRKPGQTRYTYSEEELTTLLAELRRTGRTYREPLQRYKGLGEMDADQLADTTMDPRHRTLRRVTMADEAQIKDAERAFELLMGSEVAPRKEFIAQSARQIDRSRIDA